MQKKETSQPHFSQKEISIDQHWQIGPSDSSYIVIPFVSNWISCEAHNNSFDFFYIEEKKCYYLKPNKTFIFKTKEKQNCYLIEMKPNIKELPSIPLD